MLLRLRWLFVASFTFTFAVHVLTAAHVLPATDSSDARHVLFACVNGLFAVLFLRAVRWALVPLVPLAAQQAVSHGSDLLDASRRGVVDTQSLLVLLFFPLAIGYALWLWRARVRNVA